MRRLLILACAIVFLDVTFFSAIAPLLPDYASDLGLNKAEAGVLSASYAAGTLLFALPGGWLAAVFGPRRTVIAGLLLLGVSSFAFGLAGNIVLLDAARFAQGVSGALTWAGALTWLMVTVSAERRGAVIGTALGTAIAGALFGPFLGAVAGAIGVEIVFGSVLLVASALALAASRLPDERVAERPQPRAALRAITSRPVLTATAFVAVPSTMFGAIEVLVPLRIDELGGSRALIAAGFVAGAGVEATLAPLAGRYSDRIGRIRPFVVGLSVCTAAILVFAVAGTLGGVLAALLGLSMGAGICFAPAMTMLSDSAAATGMHQGFAAGLSNMAWASGQVIGGAGGGGAASVAGNATPSVAIALLLVGTALLARRAALRSRLISPAEAPAESPAT